MDSQMATQRDADYNQSSLNTCVLLDGLSLITVPIVAHYSSPGPSRSQGARREYVNPFFCVVVFVEKHPQTALKWPNRMEDRPFDHPDSASRSELLVRL